MTEREMKRKAAARKARARKARNRRVALTICLMLAVSVVSIGGTIAWLQDSTTEIVNTFSPSNIDVDLDETGATDEDKDGNYENDSFHIVPGVDISKDPDVSASSDVDYYVFVKVKEENWPSVTEENSSDKKVSYSIDSAWTLLTNAAIHEGETCTIEGLAAGESVYYMAVNANSPITDQKILTNDTVYVSNTLTKAELEAIKNNANGLPKLTFTAYAIQQANGNGTTFSPVAAWNQAKTTA